MKIAIRCIDMKKVFFNSIIVAGLVCAASVCAQNRDWAGQNRYAQANKELAAPLKGEHRVVFLGNSITDFWPGHHPEFFSDNNYVGRGISGQTTYQFLVRFRQDVIDLKPELVVINGGTNDCAENTHPFDIDRTMANIESMVQLAQANGIKVILTSVLPATEFYWNKSITDAPQRIIALNKQIKAYADAHKIPYVDYHSAMKDGDDGTINPAFSSDGVHPNAAGYTVMENIVKPVIDSTLRTK